MTTILGHLSHIPSLQIILASKSEQRLNILKQLKFSDIRVIPSEFAEDLDKNSFKTPIEYVEATAEKKGQAVAATSRNYDILIAADTIVSHGNVIIEKPENTNDAVKMLKRLAGLQGDAGDQHDVFTAVALFINGEMKPEVVFTVRTEVKFGKVTLTDIEVRNVENLPANQHYVNTREGMNKAGAYGVQGIGAALIESIDGCYYNVMGLPLFELSRQITKLIQNKRLSSQ